MAGHTPLREASHALNREAVLCLFKHGVGVNAEDSASRTPLSSIAADTVNALLRAGADERIAASDGNKLANVVGSLGREVHQVTGDVERVHKLLAKAPVDRGWRRRGWLVMLRSRGVEAMSGNHNSDGHNAGGGGKGGAPEVVKSEGVAGVEYDGPRTTNNGVDGGLEAEGGQGFFDRAAGLLGRGNEGAVRIANNEEM